VGRINNTGLTDFNPATWNGNGKSTSPPGGANGDGSFTYPGPGGNPLGSIRLSNIADGIGAYNSVLQQSTPLQETQSLHCISEAGRRLANRWIQSTTRV
jgi:hypothetical protein